jgi:predicted transcriptional regulator
MAEDSQLIELTADIVSAHVSNNRVAVGDVADLVQRVHEALSGLGQAPAEQEPAKKEPVVSVRASVKADYIVCMECGKRQKTLKRHLQSAHGMSPSEYRKDYGLPDTYPMTAPNYSELRRETAKRLGLGSKGRTPKPAAGAAGKGKAAPKRGSRKAALNAEQAAEA